MKGIYLGACRALHPEFDLVYQDIDGTRDLDGDMLSVDLTPYDFIIATPPCNFYSRANYRRYVSKYALETRHLLPCILIKLALLDKPFLVENVRNESFMKEQHIFDICDLFGIQVYFLGRHTYFSNKFLVLDGVPQVKDNVVSAKHCIKEPSANVVYREGGINVHNVVDYFMEVIVNG